MRIIRASSRVGAVATAMVLAGLVGLMLLATPANPAPAPGGDAASVTWARQLPPAAPSARLHAAMAFDPATNSYVLFGGSSAGGPATQVLGDTWTWDGTAWTARTPATSPPPLESAAMVYDNGSRKVLLFGGRGGDGQATNGTWAWDGSTWGALSPAGAPPPRYGASAAPEAAKGTIVLFGGFSSPSAAMNDTWTWNGATWIPANPTTSPPARGLAAAAFDAARGVVVFFGGTNGTETIGDTWTWDGGTWTKHESLTVPWPRADAAMAYDPVTQRSILFGGIGPVLPFGDTWVWDGATWSLSGLGVFGPPARSGASLAGPPPGSPLGSQRIVLFGGLADKALDDTWSFAADPATPGPAPSGGPTATTPPTTRHGANTSGPTTTKAPGPAKSVPPTTAKPNGQVASAPLFVSASSPIRRGGRLTLKGGGFAANASVDISLHSSTTFRTQVKTNGDGTFNQAIDVPSTVSPGPHQIEARGPAMSGNEVLTLTASIRVAGPAAKHGWALPVAMMVLTILIVGAAGGVLTASARWPRRPSTPIGG